jgi:F0F1-type ATP synthase membrane subunit a
LEARKRHRKYFWLLGTFFVFIFFANLFGLLLDWIILVAPGAAEYVRPVNSDLNTTLVMGLTAVIVAQATGIMHKGPKAHFGHYLANYHGNTTAEKVIAVFVGWLHFVGEFVRVGSLSMRLFLNIFVGATLISVAVYVGSLIPSGGTGLFRLISMPFGSSNFWSPSSKPTSSSPSPDSISEKRPRRFPTKGKPEIGHPETDIRSLVFNPGLWYSFFFSV